MWIFWCFDHNQKSTSYQIPVICAVEGSFASVRAQYIIHSSVLWEKGPGCRSWKSKYTHFLKTRSKYLNFRFLLILAEKSVNFYMTFTAISIADFVLAQKRAVERQKFVEIYIQFYIVKKITNILKIHKTDVLQIPFLKSHISLSSWARNLGEVSFDSKFLIDYHTGRNSISATCSLFSENVK